MDFMHQFASGLVLVQVNDEWTGAGSCAAIGNRETWVTAQHCVPANISAVAIVRGGLGKYPLIAAAVHRHPSIDLAVIKVSQEGDTAPAGLEEQFYELPENVLINAGDFMGCAYPEGGAGQVERTIKGHFQRFFAYDPPSGSSYYAGEMSVPAPGGSSGGVLAFSARPREAAAIITTNHDSAVTVDSFEEVQDGGHLYKETIRRVLSYGISLMLAPQLEWLRPTVEGQRLAPDNE